MHCCKYSNVTAFNTAFPRIHAPPQHTKIIILHSPTALSRISLTSLIGPSTPAHPIPVGVTPLNRKPYSMCSELISNHA